MKYCCKHPQKPPIIFCLKDKRFYCGECLAMHKEHQFISIEEYSAKKVINDNIRYRLLRQAEVHLTQMNTMLSSIINAYILKVQQEIRQLNIQ